MAQRASRRRFLQAGLAAGGLVLLGGCAGPPAARTAAPRFGRVGLVSTVPGDFEPLADPEPDPFPAAFRRGLGDHGYVEGDTLSLEQVTGPAWSETTESRFWAPVSELLQRGIDVLVVQTVQAALAARDVAGGTPIVMVLPQAPDSCLRYLELKRNLSGAHLTGVRTIGPDFGWRRVELLKQLLPGLTQVAMLWNPVNLGCCGWDDLAAEARALGVTLTPLEAYGPDHLEPALRSATRAGARVLLVPAEPLTLSYRTYIAELAARQRLPVLYELREFVASGGLISFGPSLYDLARSAAGQVAAILRGGQAAELPIGQASRFEVVVNLKAASALGLTVPPAVLAQATEIIP
jgi:putative ABC transport system substrate-binding protein